MQKDCITIQRRKAAKNPQGTSTLVKNLAIELSRSAIVRNHGVPMPSCEAADIQSAINRVLYRESPPLRPCRKPRSQRAWFPHRNRGSRATGDLHEEVEAENKRVIIPPAVRRLGRPSEVKALFKDGATVVPKVTFVIKGEGVFKCPQERAEAFGSLLRGQDLRGT